MTEIQGEQATFADLGIWSGKMYPARSAVTEGATSKPSSRKSAGSQTRNVPMCLCLTRGGGNTQVAYTTSWEDGALLGAFTTRSFGESPREENVSRLSQILEACPPRKYSLSEKACQGILNRAERRGKKLPEALETALKAQCHSKNVQENRGARESSYRMSEPEPCQPSTISPSSTGSHHAVAYGISPYDSGAMKSSNPSAGIYEADTSRTLDNNGGNPACNQGGLAIVQEQPLPFDTTQITSPGNYSSPKRGDPCHPLAAQAHVPSVVTAVDVRNGKENECVNGTLQSKPNGGQNLNSNNVIRVELQ